MNLAAKNPPLVELAGVGKTFADGTVAVVNVSFALGEGEFVSILGPSGCGKTTILRMIAGLAHATTGTIRRAWDALGANRGDAQPIGCVFQEPTLLPWATAWDNVWLPLRLAGQSRAGARAAVDEMLELVGLREFRHAYPRQLSGGMKMRVAAARAMVTRPRLLLLDEPFAALDEITRQRLNDDLLTLWRTRGVTVLFITHSVFESVYLSNRVLVMSPRPGQIVGEVAVNLPAERDALLRTAPRYGEVCREASAALEAAVRNASALTTAAGR